MTIYKTIATSHPWWRRIPNQGLFASGVSSERTLNAAVSSPEGDWAMVYMASQCNVLIHLDRIQTRRVKATLVNPATGEAQDAGTCETGNRGDTPFPQSRQQWFSTPGHWEDAVLVLDGIA
ncbi:MAG: hypothetical protein M1546_16780 [Chloroflexi bacterium]|nr:hypothetical protein [Chloroflexota bacterium]